METLLKSKGLWHYTKTEIPDLVNDQMKFVVNIKKDEAVGFIPTYISWEIQYHTNGIDFPHQVWKKLKYIFEKVDEIHVMQLEKELISLNPHSFNIVEDYLVCVKEMQLKLGKCGKNYQNKYRKLIAMVLMNLRTPFDVFVSTFHTN
jgi:hypothetical protein